VTLPTDPKARKGLPICTGVLDYFPDAIAEVAHCSKVGNDQHNPGEPLHWDKSKSTDEADSCMRHMVQRGTMDSDGVRHSAKAAWRALANLQREIDAEGTQQGFCGSCARAIPECDCGLHAKPKYCGTCTRLEKNCECDHGDDDDDTPF